MRFVPEGLLDPGDVEAQHAQIAKLQDEALSGLDKDSYGIAHRYETVPYLALSVSPGALDRLAGSEAVASVQEDRLDTADLTTSVPQVEANEAQQFGFVGAGQTVAIIDSGVDGSHPMLAGKVVDEAAASRFARSSWPGRAATAATTTSGGSGRAPALRARP